MSSKHQSVKPKQMTGAGARQSRKAKNIPVQRSPISKSYRRRPRVINNLAPERVKSTRTIIHREMCGTYVSGTSGFQVLTPSKPLAINPRNAAIFPWLSYQASGWEHYKILKLKFTLVSGNPTTASGRVYAFIDYDYDDSAASTIEQFSSADGSVTGNVWDSISLVADPSKLHADMKWKYVLGSNSIEMRTVYCGFFNLAVNTSTALAWDLWVDYTVEFKTPQILAPTVSAELHSAFPLAFATTLPLTPANALPNTVAGIGTPPLAVQSGVDVTGCTVVDLTPVRRGTLLSACTIDDCSGQPINNVPGLAKYTLLWDKFGAAVAHSLPSYTFTTDSSSGTWATNGTPLYSETYSLVHELIAAGAKYFAIALVNTIAKAGETGNTATVTLGWRP